MKKRCKRMFALMLSCILLMLFSLSMGCNNSEKQASKHLEQLLNNLFTNISESEYEAFQNIGADLLSEDSEIPAWLDEKFKKNMTENGFRVLCETSTYYIPVLGYMNQKEFKLKNLDLKLADGYYTIQGQLFISTKEQSNQEEITVEGSAQVDDEGFVNYITITNIDEIITTLKS